MEMAEYYLEGGCDIIEMSIPPNNPYRDGPFIAEKMRVALAGCSDYDRYMRSIESFAVGHPDAEFFLLLYEEVIEAIGAKKLADFCKRAGIETIISGDLREGEMKSVLERKGIKIARPVTFELKESDIQRCLSTKGFTYMQAVVNPKQPPKPGYETLDKCIAYLRQRGITQPIYCGAGIKTPEDAKVIKQAKADGFFIGSSIISLYDDTEKLTSTIRAFRQAVEN
jgi:tryptophan synthase alpha chain